MMRLDIAAQSDIGRRKKKNEDFYGVYRDDLPGLNLFQEGALLTVADGLGGHAGGEYASKLAVSIVRDMMHEASPLADPDVDLESSEVDESIFNLLRQYMHKANRSINKTNRDLVLDGRPMGTTLLAAVVQPRKIYLGNVGDSRCYHLRDGEIIDRTEDHSWVDEQVKLGLMSKAEAESDRRKNIVTRCVGTQEEIEVDTYRWNLVAGDMILLCTDGLVNMVSDKDIQEVFQRHSSAVEIAQELVRQANENGGKDNITVIVGTINPSKMNQVKHRIQTRLKRSGLTWNWLLFLVLYGILCGGIGYLIHAMLR